MYSPTKLDICTSDRRSTLELRFTASQNSKDILKVNYNRTFLTDIVGSESLR